MVEIREAVPIDAEKICALNNSQMGYDFSSKETYDRLYDILEHKQDKIYVAVIEGLLCPFGTSNKKKRY